MAEEYDHIIKIVLCGDSAVGKSSILLRFTEGQFDPTLAATIGVDFKVHLIDLANKLKVNLTIWDTAGQEKFHSLTGSYYRGAHSILIVYDVSNRATFNNIRRWLDEIDTYATATDVIKFLIGNKIDLNERQVTTEEGTEFARANNLLFGELSAKDDIGIDKTFEDLINAVLDTPSLRDETSTKKNRDTVAVNNDTPTNTTTSQGSCYC